MSNIRRCLTFYCVMIVLAVIAGDSWGMSRKPPEPAYVQGEIIVVFKDNVSAERIYEIVKAEKCIIEKSLKRSGLHKISLPSGQTVYRAVKNFSRYSEVLSAEPNYKAIKPLDNP